MEKVKVMIGGLDYNISWNHYEGAIVTPTRTWHIHLADNDTFFYLYISKGEGKIDPQAYIDDCLFNGRITYKTDRNQVLAKCLTFINKYEHEQLQKKG